MNDKTDIGTIINLTDWYWYCDFNGYELGYPEYPILGVYYNKDEGFYYINPETLKKIKKIDDLVI